MNLTGTDLYKTCKNLFNKRNYFRAILIKLYLISKQPFCMRLFIVQL